MTCQQLIGYLKPTSNPPFWFPLSCSIQNQTILLPFLLRGPWYSLLSNPSSFLALAPGEARAAMALPVKVQHPIWEQQNEFISIYGSLTSQMSWIRKTNVQHVQHVRHRPLFFWRQQDRAILLGGFFCFCRGETGWGQKCPFLMCFSINLLVV